MRGRLELQLRRRYGVLAGVDEVGRGCLAGPVFAAATILDYTRLSRLGSKFKPLLRDSKTLSARQRQTILPIIREKLVITAGVAWAEVEEIERLGIVPATFLAMRRALAQLTAPIAMLLVDGNRPLPDYPGAQTTVVGGDDLCYCIAAASIMAKEARDAFMADQAGTYPAYGFDRNVGYGTREHLAAIADHGICELHRRNFAPITAAATLDLQGP